ncbi:hypothetical protein PIB30_061874 [Stylosanthes scabra]|uniref:PB1-like domain-containing protein n=1 Tax=Stylosanthes scabra TaxID=79078 RepID=A0ABU6QKV9_9FABA|nr:hypothetical protein [Stylosanthes scabra]
MDGVISLVYHYGRKLVTKDDGEVVYEMGSITEQADQDVDTLDVFAIRNFHRDIGKVVQAPIGCEDGISSSDSDDSTEDEVYIPKADEISNAAGDGVAEDAYDSHSDENESWVSLEMKTPPNSEEEDNIVESVMPVFKEGLTFGDV